MGRFFLVVFVAFGASAASADCVSEINNYGSASNALKADGKALCSPSGRFIAVLAAAGSSDIGPGTLTVYALTPERKSVWNSKNTAPTDWLVLTNQCNLAMTQGSYPGGTDPLPNSVWTMTSGVNGGRPGAPNCKLEVTDEGQLLLSWSDPQRGWTPIWKRPVEPAFQNPTNGTKPICYDFRGIVDAASFEKAVCKKMFFPMMPQFNPVGVQHYYVGCRITDKLGRSYYAVLGAYLKDGSAELIATKAHCSRGRLIEYSEGAEVVFTDWNAFLSAAEKAQTSCTGRELWDLVNAFAVPFTLGYSKPCNCAANDVMCSLSSSAASGAPPAPGKAPAAPSNLQMITVE